MESSSLISNWGESYVPTWTPSFYPQHPAKHTLSEIGKTNNVTLVVVIVVLVVAALAGCGVGLYFLLSKGSESGDDDESDCKEHQTLCDGKCCNSVVKFNGKCTCTDDCTRTCFINGVFTCCKEDERCDTNVGKCVKIDSS